MSSMGAVHSNISYYHNQLDSKLSEYPFLKELENKTKIQKTTIALAGVSVFFFLIFFNVGGQLITNVVGWLYPAYASFKAIESKGRDDDLQWLTYWTVFGFINCLEFFVDILLYWLPFYFVFKTVLMLWLSLPQFRGAEYVYTTFLRGFLKAYESNIDSTGSKLKNKLSGQVGPDGEKEPEKIE